MLRSPSPLTALPLEGSRSLAVRSSSRRDNSEPFSLTPKGPIGRPKHVNVVQINRVTKVTRGGRRMSFNALVVVGDGQGLVGYSLGKGAEPARAVEQGLGRAMKNMIYVERYNDRTIFHEVEGKWRSTTKINCRPTEPGHGVIACAAIKSACEAAGISDLSAKVHGSNSPFNVMQAFFNCLKDVQTPEMVARARGLHVFDITKPQHMEKIH